MKTSVSIPDKLFRKAERLAKKKRVSRSELYASAIALFVERERRRDPEVLAEITAKLNEVYGDDPQDDRVPVVFKVDPW